MSDIWDEVVKSDAERIADLEQQLAKAQACANKPLSDSDDFGAVVWKLCMDSAVQGPTDENGVGKYLRHGEFVELDDYEVALRKYLTKAEQLAEAQAEVERLKKLFEDVSNLIGFKQGMEQAAEIAEVTDYRIAKAIRAKINDGCSE